MLEVTYRVSAGLRSPSGRVVVLESLPAHRRVDCSEYSAALETIDRIISEALYAGMPCPTRPEACAAAWSVPDGAPIAMAVDNLGCELHSDAAEKMERWASERRALRRRFG